MQYNSLDFQYNSLDLVFYEYNFARCEFKKQEENLRREIFRTLTKLRSFKEKGREEFPIVIVSAKTRKIVETAYYYVGENVTAGWKGITIGGDGRDRDIDRESFMLIVTE